MFFRIKLSGERRYLQIVENTRDGASARQRVLATLGRVEDLEADGRLDALLRSGACFSETALLISSLQTGTLEASACLRIGAAMIFGRLWEQTGCRKVIERLSGRRGFGFPVERAVFTSVLHRLVVSGSDRACDKWLDAYQIDGADQLELHQLYRAMAWLGEELADQSGATRAARRNKYLIDMISAETIAELEARGIDYILGARERSDAEVRKIVLADRKPKVPLIIPRARGGETAIEVKEVVVGDWGPRCKPRRYVVCFNPEQAQRDAAARAAILDSLHMK